MGHAACSSYSDPQAHARLQRYLEACTEYERARGEPPDRYWRALLRLTTALPGLWHRVRPGIDYRRGTVSVPRGVRQNLSSGEAVLLDAALCLYSGRGSVDLAALADRLDACLFELVVATLREFRRPSRASDVLLSVGAPLPARPR